MSTIDWRDEAGRIAYYFECSVESCKREVMKETIADIYILAGKPICDECFREIFRPPVRFREFKPHKT